MSTPPKKAAVSFIFVTLVLDILGWGIIIPIMPALIKELGHTDIGNASSYNGWLIFAFAITQFVFAPLIGNLSDKYGRRRILLLSNLGFGLDYILMAMAPNLGWLFLGRILAGVTGASLTTAAAYIADVSTPENKAKNFGMIGVAFGLGFILGPPLGGLLGSFGPRVPFIACAVLCIINACWGYFILPESLSIENRRKFEWKRANPLGALLQLKKYPALYQLVFSIFLVYVAAHAVQSNWSFFVTEKFHWDAKMIGISLGVVGLLVAAIQGGLIRVVNPWLGNEKSVYIGLSMYALGMLLFATATKGWMMFVFCIPYCLGGICGPALQAIMSGEVPPNEQGELQGSLTSLMSVSTICGPLIMTHLFQYFTGPKAPIYLPGAPFLLATILLIISAVIAYTALHRPKVKSN